MIDKNFFGILIIVLLFSSCIDRGKHKNNKEILNVDTLVVDSITEKKVQKSKKIHFLDFPNTETKTTIINTTSNSNLAVFKEKIILDLIREKFVIKASSVPQKYSYANCDTNINLELRGTGISKYYIKRTEAKPKNYYPDFVLLVYQFKNETQTKLEYSKIEKALYSSGFCNGKEASKLILKKDLVFHFSTRAEMFRGYINTFAKKIENY